MVIGYWLMVIGYCSFRGKPSWLRRWALVRAFVGSRRHRDRLLPYRSWALLPRVLMTLQRYEKIAAIPSIRHHEV